MSDLAPLLLHFFVITVSLSFHEFAHAWAAYRFGDDTAARMGRLTLNPLAHMDMLGSLMILAGAPLGWAKPVPVDASRLRNPRGDGAWISFAGPASNIVLAFVFAALYMGAMLYGAGAGWQSLLETFILVNFLLAIFNLLPLPPLDGARILPSVLPRRAADRAEALIDRVGVWPLLVLLALEMIPGFTGPLGWWFKLWMPLFRPLLNLLGLWGYW
jgi:Zn-dependent protease